ncbi:adenosine kinase isoform X3 [Aplysia californica]|uniref:Adenosine kinase n=1 Tax=Aplysia californica TaxID=6500 RepID=A0ABM1A3V3_APLCA|nr:adenosine kinase isoform X3 [Aplysia californica]
MSEGLMAVQLLGFGSPLLDIVIDGDQELLDRFGLKADSCVHASGDLLSIFDHVAVTYQDTIHYTPGGATLNTIRVAQWCLDIPGSTAVIGCLSNDEFGKTVAAEMEKAGVKCFFQIKNERPTGTCLAICTENNRSLVTHGGAAELFSHDYLDQAQTQEVIQEAKYYYCSGFTLIHCPDGVHRLAVQTSKAKEKVFSLNLASVNICKKYANHLQSLMPFIDVLFGNGEEVDEFIQICGFKQVHSRAEAAILLSKWEVSGEHRMPRVVVVTQGEKPALFVQGCVQEFPPMSISPDQLVDTNGAGDAFVGGFLASLIEDGEPIRAVASGHFAANAVIKERGCTLPTKIPKPGA